MSAFLGITFALFTAIFWGFNALLLKLASRHEKADVGLILRTVAAMPILIFLSILLSGLQSLIDLIINPVIILIFISGSAVAIGDFLFLIALERTKISVALPIATAYPLSAAFFVVIFGLETISFLIILGTLLIIGGILLIIQESKKEHEVTDLLATVDFNLSNPAAQIVTEGVDKKTRISPESTISNKNIDQELDSSENSTSESPPDIGFLKKSLNFLLSFGVGVLFSLGAAIFWGFGVFTIRLLLDSDIVHPVPLTSIRILVVGLYGVFLVSFSKIILNRSKDKSPDVSNLDTEEDQHTEASTDNNVESSKTKGWIYYMLSGIVGWGAGTVLFTLSIDNIGALIATPLSSINVLVATLLGIVFLKEPVSRKKIIGTLIIMVGAIFVSI